MQGQFLLNSDLRNETTVDTSAKANYQLLGSWPLGSLIRQRLCHEEVYTAS